jgi:hypothetical protein
MAMIVVFCFGAVVLFNDDNKRLIAENNTATIFSVVVWSLTLWLILHQMVIDLMTKPDQIKETNPYELIDKAIENEIV